MSRTFEAVETIAERTGVNTDEAQERLTQMRGLALVKQRDVNGVEMYRLGPFIIGWYEAYISRIRDDREFAELFEKYIAEGGGERILSPRPGILGVVPVRGSLPKNLLQPYEDIDAHFERHERFFVGECVCMIERNLIDKSCDRTLRRCAFVGTPADTPLSESILDREQAKALFTELEKQGHVHLGFYGFSSNVGSPQFTGCCNCCGCCCGILRGTNDMGLDEGPQRSNYRASFVLTNCSACGDCVEICQVNAITIDQEGMPVLNRDRCIGCGLCVIHCSTESVRLEPVSEEEWFHLPANVDEWEERRLENLGR